MKWMLLILRQISISQFDVNFLVRFMISAEIANMNIFQLLMVCGIILTSLLQNGHASATVQVTNGYMNYIKGQGVKFSGREVNQYLGIPYAQPPVGSLRFKKTLPIRKYTPLFWAITNPPACTQYTAKPYPFYVNSTDKSEDCLYLNIWTPADASSTNKKAVLFNIHGGIYRYGSIRSGLYSGIPLASLGDIIVVTVNYRVGPFGFLSSGSEDAPGNAGLWDMLEGLKWVNQNIEAFGGDSTRITLAGEGAGAISVGLLTISPLAKGLYTRLILESGSPGTRYTMDNTANVLLAQQLASIVGCANDTYSISVYPKEVVQCLIDVDADTLSKADFALTSFPATFFPQWFDDFLPKNPRLAVDEGDFRCKDMLIGSNKDEGSFVITTSTPDLYGFFGEKNPRINRTFGEATIQNFVSIFPDSQSIVQYYLPTGITEAASYRIRHEVYTAVGDVLVVCPSVYYAEKCAEQNQNVYYYFFTHRPSVTPWAAWMGVANFDEVQFSFGQPLLHPEIYQSSEVSLSLQMLNIWSDFVKNGKPNTPWPLYSRESPSFKYIGDKFVTERNGVGPHLKNCNFLRQYY